MKIVCSYRWLIWIVAIWINNASFSFCDDFFTTNTVVVLEDHFDNGVPADTDTMAGFWRVFPDGKATCTLLENEQSSDLLDVTITGGAARENAIALLRSNISSGFNFSASAVTLSVCGLKIQTDGVETRPWESVMQFSFTSESAHPWASPDAICLTLSGNGDFVFGWKNAQAHADFVTKAVCNNAKLLNLEAIIAFDLTLGPEDYKLILHGSNNKDATFKGRYAAKGSWTPWNDSALVVNFQRNTQDTANRSIYQISELIVRREAAATP